MMVAAKLGWTEPEFWATTPRYFYNSCLALSQRERHSQEMARIGWYYTHLPRKQKGRLHVKDLMLFPWEKDESEAHKNEMKTRMLEEWKKIKAAAEARSGNGDSKT